MNTSKQMRNKTRRSSRIAALVVAIMMILAACGGDSEDSAPASANDATTFAPSGESGGDDGSREQEAPGLGSGGVGQPTQYAGAPDSSSAPLPRLRPTASS